MKRWIVIALVLGAFAGCEMPPMKKASKAAYKRWYHARAQVLYGVGA